LLAVLAAMPRGQEPLLANNRPPSQLSNDDRIAEEDALLTGQSTGKQEGTTYARRNWREIGLFAWALVATAVVVVLAVVYQHSRADHASTGAKLPEGKRNLIFMVSDGMGPTSLALTRGFRQHTEQLPWDDTLVIDQHLIGQSRTRSSSSLVTDSAAGATAFSCGHKSYNGAISVLPGFEPCGSVMEAAKRMGYTTGLVVTTRITDATPAVFASHVRRREMEDDIALQMIGETHPLGRVVDLMFGGGRCHFLPNSTDHSCRADDTDVVKLAEKGGWNYIDNRDDFDSLGTSVALPMLGLFAGGDVPYEIDRRYQEKTYPSLKEMAKTALDALSAATSNSEQGFFIMIEGSRIDHAGHANDPAAQVHEVLEFIEESDVPTLMVSTSDHETGGLATSRQLHETYPEYLWYPGVLANASHSSSWAASEYHSHLDSLDADSTELEAESKKDAKSFLETLASKGLGIHDTSDAELSLLLASPAIAAYTFADMVSRRAQLGWSTHGHSGADVNIFASNPEWAEDLVGNHENTEVGEFLARYLGVTDEVEKVTKELQQKMNVNMLGAVPGHGERLDWQDHLERYHGNSKRRCDACGM
jgi:alkaline phosphatase